MEQPALAWQGTAYVDSNFGVAPIESGFTSWNWCRGHTPEGHCEIHYDAQLRSGKEKRVSLLIDKAGHVERVASPPLQHLKKGAIWRIARPARLPVSTQASLKTLEDTPFYTRSQLQVSDRQFMHESLDLIAF
jgi:carotenoid 1,2-hydratase